MCNAGGRHLCCTLPSGKFALYSIKSDGKAQQVAVYGAASTTAHLDAPVHGQPLPAVPSHAWSPDGVFLAFALPAEKYMMIVTGEGVVHMRVEGAFSNVDWSGDGRIIVAVHEGGVASSAMVSGSSVTALILNFG